MSLLQRVERANQSVEGAKAIAPEPVAPPAPPPDRRAAREEMLREIRLRLQEEVMIAFDSILDDSKASALHGKL